MPACPGSCARPGSRRSTRSSRERLPIPPGSGASRPTTSRSPGSSAARDRRPQPRAGVGPLVDRRVVRLVVGRGRATRRARPRRDSGHLGGRGRHLRAHDEQGPGSGRPACGKPTSRPRGRGRRPRRDPPADAVRDRDRRPRGQPHRSDLHADLLGLRRSRDRLASGRLRREAAHHGRWIPAPRRVGRPQVGRRRRRRVGRRRSSTCWSSAGGRRARRARGPRVATSAGATPPPTAMRPGQTARPTSRSTATPRRRT